MNIPYDIQDYKGYIWVNHGSDSGCTEKNRPPESLSLPGAVLGGPETLPLFRR